MLGISKRGDRYLRALLIHGARSVLTTGNAPPEWAVRLAERRPANVTTVALANKTARTIWALLAHARRRGLDFGRRGLRGARLPRRAGRARHRPARDRRRHDRGRRPWRRDLSFRHGFRPRRRPGGERHPDCPPHARGRLAFTNYEMDVSSRDRGSLARGVEARGHSQVIEAGRHIAVGETVTLTPRGVDGAPLAVGRRVPPSRPLGA